MICHNQRSFWNIYKKTAELYFRVGQITVLHFIQWQYPEYQYLGRAV